MSEQACYPKGFFAEFPVPTYEEWMEEAVASLKGAPFEKKVFTKTYEDIELKPIYRLEDIEAIPHIGSMPGFPPYVRGASAGGYVLKPWLISQELPLSSPRDVNEALKHDLERGQTAVNVVLDAPSRQGLDPDQALAGTVGKKGTNLAITRDLEDALNGVSLDRFPIFVNAGASSIQMLSLFASYVKKQGLDLKSLKGCIGADPLGELAEKGTIPFSLEKAFNLMHASAVWAKDDAPGLKTILVQGTPYHNAGAGATQELAYAISTGVEYIRALIDKGLPIDQITPAMCFSFSAGSHFFMEISKLRAARLLWTRIVQAFGGSEESGKMNIHARTSSWTKTKYDPYVNMLRNTTEAFAAIAGGVDSLHVTHFDEAIRPPDEFSRRVSRNVQILLKEESHMTHPIDPGGGSWFIETLTDQIAEKSWELFQEIETAGGMYKALQSGIPQNAVKAVADKRAANLGTRKDVFIGTNKYPNMLEKPVDVKEFDYAAFQASRAECVSGARNAQAPVLGETGSALVERAVEAAAGGASIGQLTAALKNGDADHAAIQSLEIHRGAEKYEQLRRSMERRYQATGSRLKVFLANIGPIPQHKARADFSTGFFEVGGFEIISNNGFETPETAAEEAVKSGAPIIVICSTDKVYPDVVPPLTRAIKEKRPDAIVILAGMPAKEYEQSYKEAGLDDAIHIKANCLKLLSNLQKQCGLEQEESDHE